METKGQRETWGSRFGFIMAAAGSAIGLGNIWKFPYVAGESGGAVFLIFYLISVILIGFSVMLCEYALGRATNLDAIGTFKKLAPGKPWWIIGFLGVISAFVILSFYAVVAGWTMAYIFKIITGSLSGVPSNQFSQIFVDFISEPVIPLFWQALFMVLTISIVIMGIQGGIEKWSKILMPALFIILILLIIRGLTLDGAMEGVKFYLKPDFSKVNGAVILNALGQAFFSLSLGMGCMITYGSYLSKRENIPFSALNVVGLDTAIAFLAGLAIFPAVFATGMEPDSGPGLVFMILPAVFNKMPLGSFFGIIFFILLGIAALTSSISLLEVVVAFFKDQLGWSRKKATISMGIVAFLLGVPSSLSQGIWSHFTIKIPGQEAFIFFDLMDFLASNVLLPFGGMMVCLFITFVWKFKNANNEISNNGQLRLKWLPVWNFVAKYIAPIIIFLVLLQGLGVF